MRSHMLSSVAVSSGMMMLALIAVSPGPAGSQAATQSTARELGILPGDRVRLVTPVYGDDPQIGTVAVVRGDSIVFRREATRDSTTLSMAHVTRLDVSRGRHARPITGLGIGLATGAAVGSLAFLVAYKPSCPDPSGFGCGPGDFNAAGAAAGGAILAGGVIGLVVGSLSRSERWERAPLNRLLGETHAGVTVIPAPSGPRPAFRVAAHF